MIATDANYVGQLERGRIRWPQDPDRRAGFRTVLCAATDAELGFRRSRRTRSTVAEVDRQQFIRAALGTSAAAVGGPFAFADLITPTQPTPVPSVVGHAEVAEVRNAAQVFSGWDNLYGGGMIREAVMARLRYCAELLNARCAERVRADLFSAVGFLAQVTGFMAFDAYAHDDASRMFRFALQCAEESGALVRADRLTATERTMLHASRARALAKLGRVQDTASAVGVADEEFSHARPANDPVYMRFYEEFARSRVMDQIKLASLVMVTGDPCEAAMIGGQALDAASIIRSRRTADLMRKLRRFGEPQKRLAEVTELTHRIGSTVVV